MQPTRRPSQGATAARAASKRAQDVQAYARLCCTLVEQGRLGEASTTLATAMRRFPDHPVLVALHGKVLLKLGQPRLALGALTLALEAQPGNAETLSDIVLAHLELGHVNEALSFGIEAFRIAPDGARALNMSCILINLGAYEQALGFADYALGLQADHVEALGNRALALEGLARYDEAIETGARAVALAPGNPVICHNMATIALASGRYTREAWDLYEWRLQLKKHRLPSLAGLVRWEGEDIRGQTILLHAEQGMGDTLQFVRYAPMVAARGARVILAVQPALFRLLRDTPGVDELVAVGSALPHFDVYCPLLSLPRVFATTLATIPPSLPYAAVTMDRVAQTQAIRSLRVGLVWAGSPEFIDNRRRSLAAAKLGTLAGIEGATFYGLQFGAVDPPPPELQITDLMPGVQDFADTAALVAGLDLVISADTAVAHLAATMGKPVWMLSRFRGCWRWLNDRADSPWYPTMRLYRQEQPNDWQGALTRIRTDLQDLAADMREPDRAAA